MNAFNNNLGKSTDHYKYSQLKIDTLVTENKNETKN